MLILCIQIFISKFTVILFLDDMQWADASTLSLLFALLTSTSFSSRNLLLICAYRDNEVDNAHLFKFFMDDIEKKSIPTNHVILTPLRLEDTQTLIMDLFHCDYDQSLPLSTLVQQQTSGNPLFVCQLLRSIPKAFDKIIDAVHII